MVKLTRLIVCLLFGFWIGGCDPLSYSVRYSLRPDITYYAQFGIQSTAELQSCLIKLADSLAARYELSDTSRSGQCIVKEYSTPAGLLSAHMIALRLEESDGRLSIDMFALSGADREYPKEILAASSLVEDLCNSLTIRFGSDSFILSNKHVGFDYWKSKP